MFVAVQRSSLQIEMVEVAEGVLELLFGRRIGELFLLAGCGSDG